MKKMKQLYIQTHRYVKILAIVLVTFAYSSCADFLDIVPDNVATIDHAFSNTLEAEKYLFTCYYYLPSEGTTHGNVGLLAGDELWIPDFRNYFLAATWTQIARGNQNINNPAANYWDGEGEGMPLFKAIRHCNIFLENVENLDKVKDLPLDKRVRWIAEVKFLKAYYHYYLLRMYGPIPIVDKNIEVSAPAADVRAARRPVDECAKYIVDLLDDSYEDLPAVIYNKTDELGRVTKSINLAVKARVLLLMASPLFSGNSAFATYANKDGELLFNSDDDATTLAKWKAAADATKAAIDFAEGTGGNSLYYYKEPDFKMTDTTMIQMSIRGAVTTKWNSEVVWGLSNSVAHTIQRAGMPLLTPEMGTSSAFGSLAPPLKIVQQFYTKNGVPIEEDKTFSDFDDIKKLRVALPSERVNFEVRYETARINFDRENRFYASIGFDGGKWLTADLPARVDYEAHTVKAKVGQISSGSVMGIFSETGYYTKKVVNWESNFAKNASTKGYPWPAIRLADLYLMYAEALNEAEGPTAGVHQYLDLIRKRAGLESVQDSWRKYSRNPTKPATKDGMREIIHRERLIEMAFEGSRFWDLRRWKKAESELNNPITGWDISRKDAQSYYQIKTIWQQKFIAPRDYFWPIRMDELSVNPNLVQGLGW